MPRNRRKKNNNNNNNRNGNKNQQQAHNKNGNGQQKNESNNSSAIDDGVKDEIAVVALPPPPKVVENELMKNVEENLCENLSIENTVETNLDTKNEDNQTTTTPKSSLSPSSTPHHPNNHHPCAAENNDTNQEPKTNKINVISSKDNNLNDEHQQRQVKEDDSRTLLCDNSCDSKTFDVDDDDDPMNDKNMCEGQTTPTNAQPEIEKESPSPSDAAAQKVVLIVKTIKCDENVTTDDGGETKKIQSTQSNVQGHSIITDTVSNPTNADNGCGKMTDDYTDKLNDDDKEQKTMNMTTKTSLAATDDHDKIVNKNLKTIELHIVNYRVESPQLERKFSPPKTLGAIKKSRSLDDNEPQITILELSDTSSTIDSNLSNPPIISEVSDGDLTENDGIMSPMSEEVEFQTDPLSPTTTPRKMTKEEEQNLRGFLRSLNIEESAEVSSPEIECPSLSLAKQEANDLKIRRARKRAEIESHFLPLIANPRYLDIIKEEGSDTSDIDRKSEKIFDDEYGDDDVFIDNVAISKKANAVFPKSHLDFNKTHKHVARPKVPALGDVIREESPCILVESKIVETSVTDECSSWTTKLLEVPTGAETVYLDSCSSTSSDVMDLDYTADVDEPTDCDSEVRIETPVIGGDVPKHGSTDDDNSDQTSGFSRETTPEINNSNTINKHNDAFFARQDSEGSACSSIHSHSTTHSTSTARYLTSSPQTDFESISDKHTTMGRSDLKTLRQLCVEALASMPYGGAILEELATVSESLSHLTKAKEEQMRNVIPVPPATPPYERSPSPPPLPPPVAPARNRRKIIIQQEYEPPLPSPPLPSPPPPPIPSPPKFENDEFVIAAIEAEIIHKTKNDEKNRSNVTNTFVENVQKLAPSHTQTPNVKQTDDDHHQTPHRQHEIKVEMKRDEGYNKNDAHNSAGEENSETFGSSAGAANSNTKNRLLAIIRETEQEQQQSFTENSTNKPNESEYLENKPNNNNKSENKRCTNISDPDNMFAHQNYKSPSSAGIGKDTDDIFEEFNKRFSNIEQSFRPISVNLDDVTKRYSNLETSSFEQKKRLENGNVVFEKFDKNRQKLSSVDGKIIENHIESESKLVGDKTMKNERIAENKNYEHFPHYEKKLHDEKSQKQQEQHSTQTESQQSDQKTSKPKQKDELIFKEFDFVPKTIKTDPFFASAPRHQPSPSTAPVTTNLHEEKSKSHHNIFFGKPNPFEELNEEFKRKFETQLRSSSGLQRPMSLHETMRLNSNNFNDWMKHAKTQMSTESSENITKPIQKEEFMVRGNRSFSTAEIRAPRISPNHIESDQYEEIHRQYDTSVNRRDHILQTRQSMIDQTPITGHVSMERTRRMSLPKELHDKQLTYIRQKERELQAEFERLESERRKLEKEMTDWSENIDMRAHGFGSQQLSEAEEFRQKMHNEWLNKVAEREERRMQKIVKISKSTDETPLKHSASRTELGDEFLHKVKERRSKLNMPSDSDWESGAESQPIQDDKSPKERIINIKIIEGEKEADPKQLPKHLQEFLEYQQQQLQQQQTEGEKEAVPKHLPKHLQDFLEYQQQHELQQTTESTEMLKEECTKTTTASSSKTMSTKDGESLNRPHVFGLACAIAIIGWSVCRAFFTNR